MRCYLDMSLNTLNFTDARTISKKYVNYPVESWAKLFRAVSKTLELDDAVFEEVTEDTKKEEYHTKVVQEEDVIRIIQPAGAKIVIDVIEMNLELYFSEYPFDDVSTFNSIRPSKQIVYEEVKETIEHSIKRADFESMKDVSVEITEHREGLAPKKISSFTWSNPEIKVKI
jgi:hypothetical protein